MKKAQAQPTSRKPFSLRKAGRVAAYASGYAFVGGVAQVQTLYYMNFLLYAMNIGPMAALILGLSKVWDGFIDPVIGVLVDKIKSKFGTCRLFILISVVPIFFTYFMMWHTFGINGYAAKVAYFFFAQILFSTAASLGAIPYEALLPRMIDDYGERTDYSAFRTIFSGISAVVSTYIYALIIPDGIGLSDYPQYLDRFSTLGIVLGIMFAIPMLITALGTKEKKLPFHKERTTLRGVFTNYFQLLKSKLHRKFFAIYSLGTFVSYAMSISLVIFILLIYGDMKPIMIGKLALPPALSLSFLVVNIRGAFEIGFFVPNVIMMKKKNKQFPILIDIPLLAVACVIFFFTTPNTPILICLIGTAFLGMGISCLNLIPNTLMADLPDVDELIYGKRREGENGGLASLSRQIVQGLSFFIFGVILEAFKLSEDTASPEAANAATLSAVKIMLCALPLIGGAAMLILSKLYNLDAKKHTLIKDKISEKRSSGTAEVSESQQKIFAEITGMPYNKLWISRRFSKEDAEYAGDAKDPALG